MANKFKKIISLILSVLMIFSTASVAFAAETSKVTVEIISFMRGEQSDLRSSELLEAHVEGYDGNVRELTYKWKSTLGTYLYVYNSHNMYNINNTDGEIEIHNTDKNMAGLSNMVGRTYNKEFAGVGYAWASVYGASIKGSTSLVGTVTVEVYDRNGILLCSDSHEGKYSNRKNTGFVTYNLDADMDNVVLGLFEGDKRNVKDLLGESAVVHITCVESTVSKGTIIAGAEHVKLTKENGDYYITGTVAGTSTDSKGDAQVDLDITKGNCKFHNGTSGDAVTTVFVFKKPTTSTTTTTLTLTGNLDDRCDYFIGGVEGTKQADGTIIFTGLTPNTNYTVEVRGEYKDNNGTTKYSYAYVYDTTKPVYQATVHTYLDSILTDIADIHGDDVTLYLHEDKENAEYIELANSAVGTYTVAVENGIYFPWHIEAGDHYHQAREYKLIIENANGELSLHHYSVAYDTNGGAFKEGEDVVKEAFSSGASVSATNNIPVREGYIFVGWEYDGKIYSSGEEVTSHITAPVVLTAKWEKAVNVTVNVTINHKVDGGFDSNENKDELVVDFLEQRKDSPAFIETGDKLYFSKEDVTDEKGNSKAFEYTPDVQGGEILETKYTAIAPTYEGLLESSYFGVALSKSGYDVGIIEKIKDEEGNWTINIPLQYNPDDFDLEFSIKMDEDVPKELYPDAVIIKIACWDEDKNEWVIITQQRTTESTVRPGVRVDIDEETGEGKGSYPVWKFDSDNNPYGYRAVVAGFIYDNSTVIVPAERDHDGAVITYTDGNYTATMGDIHDGKLYSTRLYGAYYDVGADAQKGTLDGVITVEKYDVTFDAQSGKVNGKDEDVAKDQYYVPSFDAYQPTMENHNFLGWYRDKDCTVPAKEGVLLTEDITLYAKWDRVLRGTLTVDGYYTDSDGVQHVVNDSDRATHALIELEEITNDGTYNIAGQTVEINWSPDKHFSEPVDYAFKGLDPDKTYRIDVYLINYEGLYQNSTTVINGNGDIHDDYNTEDYTAVYPEDSELETYVNTFLHFEPEVYFQPVEVDATRIGEGFRPEETLVEYLGKEVGTDTDYGVIVQHKSEPFGVVVGMDEASGLNSGVYGCQIWKKIYNGNLYDYQAKLTEINGEAISEWPVIVSYGAPVRWSPYSQAPTDSLKVTIIPRWYYVIYDWNGAEDEYGEKIVEPISRGHIWSFKTDITYVPEREGYNFLGWYSNPECTGDPVTSIAAGVHEDTRLYAKWEKTTLTVKHVDIAGNKILDTELIDSVKAGDIKYSAEYIRNDFEGYTYVSAGAESIEIGHGINEIILYYTDIYAYSVFYYIEGTETEVHGSKVVPKKYGDNVTETAAQVDKYVLADDDVTKTITIDKENNVIIFYYTQDSLGKIVDDRIVSDGIADKYQKKITFRVINGAWSDGKDADIIKYVTLEKDGKYDVNGTASISAPMDMKADEGYENGEWDITPPSTVSGTNDEVYTYTFVKKPASETPENPDIPDVPDTPDGPVGGGSGNSEVKHHILFGKTDGIGWYRVSKDGGKTYDIVFGNSTYEVEQGTEIIIKVGDLMGDAFTFYVNGKAVEPDNNGNLVITVNGYMLIGALGYKFNVPDIEESLNWLQRIIKAIKDFFAWLFGKK
ncbi:MAG: InlB B-repeat-containing protein [Clostridia bacterium]|nr:InlB B-repeat-containing protein [Clostridia bacterium]